MLAFEKAIEAGCDGIELDVHLSKDGELMVIHDFTLDRTTDFKGNVGQYTKEELKRVDAGKGQKIPTLDEVFLLLEQYSEKNLQLNIELKAGSRIYKGIENEVIKKIYQYDYLTKAIISSFDHKALVEAKEIDQKVKTGALTASAMYKPWDYLKMLKVNYYHPNYMTVDSSLIVESIKENIPINVYTVNDQVSYNQLMASSVNGIITNYPDAHF
jgi:glycerophosphoryl diester phosphodiesterase